MAKLHRVNVNQITYFSGMQQIKNIIFDLGGVILNIDFKKTNEAFRRLGIENIEQYVNQFHISDIFLKYELGQIDDLDFLDSLARFAPSPLHKEQMIAAWDAMLLEFPKERIELLRKIKPKYRTFLLSNTNSLHIAAATRKLQHAYATTMEDLFEKVYYSHTVHMRKPNADIFQLLLNENNLAPGETLFIDDTETNFENAIKLGIQIHHLVPGTTITGMDIFKDLS